MMNSSFLDYRMPTSLDLPMIDTVIVEVANPGHPLGVRGVGEVSLVPPMAAIANAIHDAVGVRMDTLPMNPGSVLEALWEQNLWYLFDAELTKKGTNKRALFNSTKYRMGLLIAN